MTTRPPRRARLAALPAALLLLASLGACGGGGAGEGDGPAADGETLRPRIAAEHPVTSPPAREAGLLEDGALDGVGNAGGPGTPVLVFLPATDLEESLDFYRGLLALEVSATEPAEPPFRRVELTPPGPADRRPPLRLVLVDSAQLAAPPFPPPAGGGTDEVSDEEGEASADQAGGGPAAGAVPAWPVADLAAVARRLEEAGVATVERSVPSGRSALAVVDPAGNRLLLLPSGAPVSSP